MLPRVYSRVSHRCWTPIARAPPVTHFATRVPSIHPVCRVLQRPLPLAATLPFAARGLPLTVGHQWTRNMQYNYPQCLQLRWFGTKSRRAQNRKAKRAAKEQGSKGQQQQQQQQEHSSTPPREKSRLQQWMDDKEHVLTEKLRQRAGAATRPSGMHDEQSHNAAGFLVNEIALFVGAILCSKAGNIFCLSAWSPQTCYSLFGGFGAGVVFVFAFSERFPIPAVFLGFVALQGAVSFTLAPDFAGMCSACAPYVWQSIPGYALQSTLTANLCFLC